jgi:WD40 repeat protein
VAVGRTDGSVFIVKLGEEYLTNFDDIDEAGMTRRTDISDFVDEGDEQMVNKRPFEIMHQFLASQQGHPINKLVYHDSIKGSEYLGIVCTAAGTTGEITIWKLPSNDTNDRGIIQSIVLSGIHNDEIISLKTIVLQSKQDDIDEQEVLFSASRDGKFALWNLRNGELLLSCKCAEEMAITCADVFNPSSWDDSHSDSIGIDDDVIFLGTSSGYVFGYVIQELITLSFNSRDTYKNESINAVPSIRFHAHGMESGKGDATTAIACGGYGTIPSSSRTSTTNPSLASSILLTGGEDGTVKQW